MYTNILWVRVTSGILYFPYSFRAFQSLDNYTLAIKNISNMHAVSMNPITPSWHLPAQS